MPSKSDIYQDITSKVLKQIEEKGDVPWVRPWSGDAADGRIARPLRHNGVPYSGMNVLLLWMAQDANGYSSPHWMTFRQAREYGASVRQGEKSTPIIYFDRLKVDGRDEEDERTIPFVKGYAVFNANQVDGLPEKFYTPLPISDLTPHERIERSEEFLRSTGADIRYGGGRAYYAQHDDHVQLPPFQSFQDPESFYTTALHELAHWTKHPSRLDRDLGRKKWGDRGYAEEELVGELAATFLAADLGLEMEPRDEHARYLAHWVKAMQEEPRFIFQAVSNAQRATDYLHSLQPKLGPELPEQIEQVSQQQQGFAGRVLAERARGLDEGRSI